MTNASVYLMGCFDEPEIISMGVGDDVSNAELEQLVKDVIGYHGRIKFDSNKPDGALRKLLDVSKFHALGWHSNIGIKKGWS